MKKIIEKIRDIDKSWFGALAIVFFISSIEFGFATTGSYTLTQGIKGWVEIITEAAYWIAIGVTIVAFITMLVLKNWGIAYWVVGAAITAYIIANIQQFFTDGGVTGAIF